MIKTEREEAAADWRAVIRAGLATDEARRERTLFAELNPQLIGHQSFEARWSDRRRDAAVLIPIIPRAEGPTVLLTVRAADLRSHAGQISFPGGGVSAEDTDAIAAALRETHEEVNIPPAMVDVIGAFGAHKGGLGFSVTPVVGVVDPAAPFRADPGEVAEIFETPLAFIADLANHGVETRLHDGVEYKMFALPFGRYHIWGLTAGILKTLADTLQSDGRGLRFR